MPEWLLLLLVALLMLGGFIGSFLPGLPGTPLILLAALLHKWLAPLSVPWWLVIAMIALAAFGQLLEILAGVIGAKWFGASRWGLVGAGLGLIVGLFFSIPGLIFGPLLGAIVGELTLGRREPSQAAKAGVGAGLGFAAGLAIKVLVSLTLIGLFWITLLLTLLRPAA